jgi:hypothetical protein
LVNGVRESARENLTQTDASDTRAGQWENRGECDCHITGRNAGTCNRSSARSASLTPDTACFAALSAGNTRLIAGHANVVASATADTATNAAKTAGFIKEAAANTALAANDTKDPAGNAKVPANDAKVPAGDTTQPAGQAVATFLPFIGKPITGSPIIGAEDGTVYAFGPRKKP